VLLALALAGCGSQAAAPRTSSNSQAEVQARHVPAAPAVVSPALTQEIPLVGHESALVHVPAGDQPLPALFVTHGAGGSAEEHLRYWSELGRDRYIIFSLSGSRIHTNDKGAGFYYKNHHELERELLALIEVLRDPNNAALAYVQRLQPPPWHYAGYSQGATMGALFLLDHGELFDRAIFIEGGTEGVSALRAQRFYQHGGQKLLWVCGTLGCNKGALRASSVAREAGLEARAVHVSGAGHIYWGQVAEQVALQLTWVLEQVPPFSGDPEQR
jgi:pimeloyl-ACP methyl ester carboxylesterase